MVEFNKIVISVLSLLLIVAWARDGKAETYNELKVYVWEFGTRDEKKNELTANLTREFEETLIKQHCAMVLERRNYDKLMSQKDNEKSIMSIEGISAFSMKNLQAIEASGVVFGEIYDDVQSGELKIIAKVQRFNGQNMAFDSVRLPRGRRFDAASRESSMKELAIKICSSLSHKSPEPPSGNNKASPPIIHSFTTDKNILKQGQSVTLFWNTTNSSVVKLRRATGILLVTEKKTGEHSIMPTTSETYTLIVENLQGMSIQRSISISVRILCEGRSSRRVRLEYRRAIYTKERVKHMILKRNFREHDWNPGGDFQNSYETYDKVVVDCSTGLMWQRNGSERDTWSWHTAPNYIKKLNAMSFAGYNDWRLPTIEELSSLIEPWKNRNGLYINEVFSGKANFWSADDWRTNTGTPVAWSANFDYGGIFHGGAKVNRFYVRGVRSIQ